MGQWLEATAKWSLRAVVVAIGLLGCLWLLSWLWVGVLPVVLALIVAALLSSPSTWLSEHRFPRALAAAILVVGTLLLLIGIFLVIGPQVATQFQSIDGTAVRGVDQIRTWLKGPPFDIASGQLDELIDESLAWARSHGGAIASGAFSGLAKASSALINVVLVIVLTFFFLKDGHRFLPWLRSFTGPSSGRHLSEVLSRNWRMLAGFIRTQALVGAIDAVLIGLGLVLLDVPLALALAVITFFAGFIPIVGAVSAGFLAVLVALVSNGWQVALAVGAVVLLVQQLEGNVLSPWLQGQTIKVHPGVILMSVTIGATLFGIVGAFLAVPCVAALAVTLRYLNEQLTERAGETPPQEE